MRQHAARRRGSIVAEILRTSWRPRPEPLNVDEAGLHEVETLLVVGGAAGLAWRRVRGAARAQAAGIGTVVADAWRLQALEGAVREDAAAQVVACLAQANVTAVFGKGWVAARLYPVAALRPFVDVDVYVAPRDMERARQALAARQPLAMPVDLHAGCPDLRDRRYEELVERARLLPLADTPVRVFSAEDHLRLLCLHALRHGAWRPLWLCDVAALLEAQARDLDWTYVSQGDPRRCAAVAHTLGLTRTLLGAEWDGAGERVAGPAWLEASVLAAWGGGPGWREPMAGVLRRRSGVWRELQRRWPNAVEATLETGASFDRGPRWPLQVRLVTRRAWAWLGRTRR